jgi:hypothetical protein
VTAVVKGPSRAGYWVSGACLLAVAVSVLVTFWGAVRIIETVEDFVTIPGTAKGQVVRLTESGKYTVFIEGRGILDETDVPAVVLVVEGPDGATQRIIPDRGAGMDFSYEISGRSGARLGSFRVDEPGAYRIRLESGVGGEPGNFPTYMLHFGRLDFGAPVVAMIGGFVVAGIFTLAAIILFIVTIVRRNTFKRRHGPMLVGYPGGYVPPGAWSPPPAGGGWSPPPAGPGGGWPPPPPPAAPPPPQPGPWGHTNPPGGWKPPSESSAPSPTPGAPSGPPVGEQPAGPPPTSVPADRPDSSPPDRGEDDTTGAVGGPTAADEPTAAPQGADPAASSDAPASEGSDGDGSSSRDPGGRSS